MRHILERFVIHFFSATSLVLIVATLLRYLSLVGTPWLPQTLQLTLAVSALIVFAVSTLREAWDVAKGQSTTKALTDYASWLLGVGFGAWGLYRWALFWWS